MNTVNVIEMVVENGVLQLLAFQDNPEGNRDAEEAFRKIAKENGCHDKTIAVALEDGYVDNGTWSLYIVHSTNVDGWQEDDECPNCHCGTLGLENGQLVCRGECGEFIEKDFKEAPQRCKKCGSFLQDNGLCNDLTCPYSDRQQNETYTEG